MWCSSLPRHTADLTAQENRVSVLRAHVEIICLLCCMPYLDALAATFCMAYSTRDSAEFASALWSPPLICAPAGCLALACKGLLVTSHKMATAGAPWVAFACTSASCHLAPCCTQISLECLIAVVTFFTSTAETIYAMCWLQSGAELVCGMPGSRCSLFVCMLSQIAVHSASIQN